MGADRRPSPDPRTASTDAAPVGVVPRSASCRGARPAEERALPRSAPCRAVARPLPLCAGSDGLRRGDRRASVVAARSRLPGAARKQRTTLQPIQYSSNEVARVGESPRERRSGEGRTHIRFHAPLVAQRRAPPGFRRRSYGSTRLHTCTSSRRPESSPRDALRGVRGRSVPSATPRTLAVRLASSRPAWEEVGPWGVAGRERSALNFTGASMGTTPQSARPFQGAP